MSGEDQKIIQNAIYDHTTKDGLTIMWYHTTLNENQKQWCQWFEASLSDAYPQAAEEWENDFKCDVHPDKEIRIWIYITLAYLWYKEIYPSGKKDVLNVLLATSMKNETAALESLEKLSKEQALDIVSNYKNKEWLTERVHQTFGENKQ